MPHGDWNIAIPVDHTKIGDVPSEIRDLLSSAKLIIAKEHATPGTSGAGGQHLKGASRVYLGSGLPTVDPEGNSLDTSATSDNGRLAIDTSASNTLKVYIATSAGVSTGFQVVRVERVKMAETFDANSNLLVNVPDGTQSGQAVHVGMLDTGHLKLLEPATSGKVGLLVNTAYLATAHITGLTVRGLSLDTSVASSAGGLTCTPRTYAGGQSVTFPNGLIIKMGTVSVAANNNSTVTFDAAFPTGVIIAIAGTESGARVYTATVVSKSTTTVVVRNTDDTTRTLDWIVIGY